MAPFKFPPPPPPPKAAPIAQPYESQRGGYTRGGGDRGRGRGDSQNRGGGFHSSSGNPRGGYGQNRGRGDARGRGGQRGGHQDFRGGGNPRRGFNAGNGQPQTNAPPHPGPANAYVNPSFKGSPQAQAQTQQQVDPNALAQVMSFMSTPAGVQSMAAFAGQMTSTGNAAPSYPQSPPPQYNQSTPRYSTSQHAGQKRKLNDRNQNAQPQRNPQQPSSKPPRAKAAVPPQIPSFGFSLPPPVVVKPDDKKRKVNLGLSKQPVVHESSDEEDVDEEATYQEKLKGGGFAFEHEGEMISIRTGAEVGAWIKDRRKNFPTQQRIMEKVDEVARKRMNELDFLRRLKGKPPKDPSIENEVQPAKIKEMSKEKQAKQEANAKRRQEAEAKRQEELAALRKKLHESMMKKRSAPVDLGLGYDSATESDEASSVLSESSVVSSSSEEEESDPESSDDSDEAPEPISSKIAPPSIKAPPPPPAAAPSKPETRMCSNWQRSGRCPYLYKCKYQHPPKKDEEMKLGVGLYERMVEQELVKSDQLALNAIKYLGQHGFLG